MENTALGSERAGLESAKIQNLVGLINKSFSSYSRRANNPSPARHAHTLQADSLPEAGNANSNPDGGTPGCGKETVFRSRTDLLSISLPSQDRANGQGTHSNGSHPNLEKPPSLPTNADSRPQEGGYSIMNKARSVTYWEERELYTSCEELCCFLSGGINYRLMFYQTQEALNHLLRSLKQELAFFVEQILAAETTERLVRSLGKLLSETVQILKESKIELPAELVSKVESLASNPVSPDGSLTRAASTPHKKMDSTGKPQSRVQHSSCMSPQLTASATNPTGVFTRRVLHAGHGFSNTAAPGAPSFFSASSEPFTSPFGDFGGNASQPAQTCRRSQASASSVQVFAPLVNKALEHSAHIRLKQHPPGSLFLHSSAGATVGKGCTNHAKPLRDHNASNSDDDVANTGGIHALGAEKPPLLDSTKAGAGMGTGTTVSFDKKSTSSPFSSAMNVSSGMDVKSLSNQRDSLIDFVTTPDSPLCVQDSNHPSSFSPCLESNLRQPLRQLPSIKESERKLKSQTSPHLVSDGLESKRNPSSDLRAEDFKDNESKSGKNEKEDQKKTADLYRDHFFCLKMLYGEHYKNSGMKLILDALALVFAHEYDKSKDNDELALKNDFCRFKEDLFACLTKVMKNYGSFAPSTAQPSPLRSMYLTGCLSQHTKPQPRVLDALSDRSDRKITELLLSRVPLTDRGGVAVLGLLHRMTRLRRLDLSCNQLGDATIHILSAAVRHHPALEMIDLSQNYFTDKSLESLLAIVRTAPRLQALRLKVCRLSTEGKQMVEDELARPRPDILHESDVSSFADAQTSARAFTTAVSSHRSSTPETPSNPASNHEQERKERV